MNTFVRRYRVRCLVGLALLIACIQLPASAQDVKYIPYVNGAPPPTPQPGHQICLVRQEAEYKTVRERVMTRQATYRTETIPARYEDRPERVLVRPASRREIPVPAEYETVSRRVMVEPERTVEKIIPAQYENVTRTVVVKPACTDTRVIPAQYDTVSERVLVREAEVKMVKIDCMSEGGDCAGGDCDDRTKERVLECYHAVTVPAEYQTKTRRVLIAPERTETRTIPAVTRQETTRKLIKPACTECQTIPARYETRQERVIRTPASVRCEEIPAEYETVMKRVMVEPARTKRIEIPAEYEDVERRVLVCPERLVWVQSRIDPGQIPTGCPTVPRLNTQAPTLQPYDMRTPSAGFDTRVPPPAPRR